MGEILFLKKQVWENWEIRQCKGVHLIKQWADNRKNERGFSILAYHLIISGFQWCCCISSINHKEL